MGVDVAVISWEDSNEMKNIVQLTKTKLLYGQVTQQIFVVKGLRNKLLELPAIEKFGLIGQ